MSSNSKEVTVGVPINKATPVKPAASTVTRPEGVSSERSYSVTTPVPGSVRRVNEGRKD
jgi:hypothetical protein